MSAAILAAILEFSKILMCILSRLQQIEFNTDHVFVLSNSKYSKRKFLKKIKNFVNLNLRNLNFA